MLLMKKTVALISFGDSMTDKYGLIKTALISDVISDCLHKIKDYLERPIYQKMYDNPETKRKITVAIAALTDLLRHLDTPPSHLIEKE